MQVRNEVLGDMVRNGAITRAEADAATAEKLEFRLAAPAAPTTPKAGFFVEYVRRLLQSKFDLTDAEILGGGLQVHTTLDQRAQEAADRAVADTFDRPEDPEVALLAMDTEGRIRAMTGGRDVANIERSRGFNYAYQGTGRSGGRHAGSAFKPFTLAAWVAEGRELDARFAAPSTIRIDSSQCRDDEGKEWSVSNFDRSSYAPFGWPRRPHGP